MCTAIFAGRFISIDYKRKCVLIIFGCIIFTAPATSGASCGRLVKKSTKSIKDRRWLHRVRDYMGVTFVIWGDDFTDFPFHELSAD